MDMSGAMLLMMSSLADAWGHTKGCHGVLGGGWVGFSGDMVSGTNAGCTGDDGDFPGRERVALQSWDLEVHVDGVTRGRLLHVVAAGVGVTTVVGSSSCKEISEVCVDVVS